MDGDIIVLKFGGSVLRRRSDVPAAVHEIYRWYRAGWRVVALGGPSGEQRPASLLGIELERVGVPARFIDAGDMDLPAPPDDIEQLQTLLKYTPVLVVAGPGNGGQDDLWAVYLANVLRASRCRLLKDVDGVYETDPARLRTPGAVLQRFSALGYADALELASTPIKAKAVKLLNKYLGRAEVASIASPYESVIGRFDRTPAQAATTIPTTVLILGCADLAASIYQRISAMSDHFLVIGLFHADGDARSAEISSKAPLFASLEATMGLRPDVVIDTLFAIEPAHALDCHFLERGASVVSANLPLIAEAGRKLNTLAARCNTYLRYNAAVGGSAPVMEALRREIHLGDIRSIAAVFSGEASRILDRCSKGFEFEALLASATAELGAVAIHEEMSGIRSARKLCVLARHAFGHDPDAFRVEPFDARALAQARDSLTENCTLRLVARAWKISHRVFAQLQVESLDTRDPLAQVQPDWNRLVVAHRDGRHGGDRQVIVQGRDGRWSIAEALIADLLDVRFAHLALSRRALRTAL